MALRRGADPILPHRHITPDAIKAGVRYGVIVLSVMLAWQIVVALLADRAPVDVAVIVAPRSSTALVRAADGELAAQRYDNAADLAGRALRIAPFDAHALSIVGRVQAVRGDISAADETMTLAGNWSLREDPTHAWLVDRRLRQGAYASAFAHAETLVRRRVHTEPQLFEMFTVAAAQPAGLSVLLRALSVSPPWRKRYLAFLSTRPGIGSDVLYTALAVNLQETPAPLSDEELANIYQRWLGTGRLAAIQDLRDRLNRPAVTDLIWNGGFNPGAGVLPMAWDLSTGSGFSVQIGDTGDAQRGGGLLVAYDGVSGGILASQLVFIKPGPAAVRVRQLVFGDLGESKLEWHVTCFEGSTVPIRWSEPGAADAAGWRHISGQLSIPATDCTAQYLQLHAIPGDRRRSVSVWFDDVRISQNAARAAP